jgi:hypothetical protein
MVKRRKKKHFSNRFNFNLDRCSQSCKSF